MSLTVSTRQSSKSQSRKTGATTIDNITGIKDVDEIFSLENPTIKDILIVLKEICTSQQFVGAKYDELLKKNLELENLCNDLRTENIKLKEETNKLSKDIRKVEKNLNDKKIEIHGITERANEDINELVKTIGNSFNLNINTEDIDEAYRVHKKASIRKNNPIIVSFSKKKDKEQFLLMRKNKSLFTDEIGLSDTRSQIFINEYLPKQTKELLWNTKKLKNEKKYKYLWIKNGTILLRKHENSQVIVIDSQEDLDKLN